jgi:hypothetical protein
MNRNFCHKSRCSLEVLVPAAEVGMSVIPEGVSIASSQKVEDSQFESQNGCLAPRPVPTAITVRCRQSKTYLKDLTVSKARSWLPAIPLPCSKPDIEPPGPSSSLSLSVPVACRVSPSDCFLALCSSARRSTTRFRRPLRLRLYRYEQSRLHSRQCWMKVRSSY